jgi:multiple sugar transport system permease protein
MLRKIGLHTGLVLACLSILLPVLWIVRTSLVPESMAYSSDIFPQFSAENFRSLIENNGFYVITPIA